MHILGIDPGTARMGFGVLSVEKDAKRNIHVEAIDYGLIETPSDLPFSARLRILADDLKALLDAHHPGIIVIEKLYFSKNTKTALSVAEARGVAQLIAMNQGAQLIEITPKEVKQQICGYGGAEKRQIQVMVKNMLRLKETPKPDDVADALALAICGSYTIPGVVFRA